MNPYTSVKSDNPETAKSNKKAYQSPTLVLYGNISEITRAVAHTSTNMDGGTGQTDKTS